MAPSTDGCFRAVAGRTEILLPGLCIEIQSQQVLRLSEKVLLVSGCQHDVVVQAQTDASLLPALALRPLEGTLPAVRAAGCFDQHDVRLQRAHRSLGHRFVPRITHDLKRRTDQESADCLPE